MGKWLLAAIILFSGGALVAVDVEAKRLGGARSSGVQRNVTTPPAATPAKPAQQAAPAGQQAAPVAGAAAGTAMAAKAAPAGLAKWFPMLGGLALGGMLGWLLASNGGSFLMLVLLAIAAFFLVRAFARRAAPAQTQTMQYAGGGRETVRMEPSSGSGTDLPARGAASLPAGFDADGFLRGAKMNFVRLQVANDRGSLDDIREFTTPEMFETLSQDVHGRGGAAQQTDVSGLNAELLEVAQDGGNYWASVHFSGTVREAPGAADEPFAEVWNLVKPVDGSAGWLLAGIQQVN
jgi:predicted lipid-binding transport protein (Tim44 family)